MKLRFIGVLLAMALAAFTAGAASADPITVTFHEVGGPTDFLDGTSFYTGLTFENVFQFGPDDRLPDDGFGITNIGPSMTVGFVGGVHDVSFTWATADTGVDFFADAYDAADVFIGSYVFLAGDTVGPQFGTGSVSGDIWKIVFHEDGNTIAVDTLTYDAVPEPATLALFAFGAAGLARKRLRRKSAA